MENKPSTAVTTYIERLSPVQLVEDPKVSDKFITLYNSIHGSKQGELFYHKEKFNYLKLLSENQALKDCTKLSLYGCFLDVAVNGLSFETGNKPLAYITTRNFNVGTRENPKFEKRAAVQISPYGELVMRMRSGQIRHADNPVIVYEGDTFQPKITPEGKKTVLYEAMIPRKSDHIIGAFIRITRNDGTVDFEWMVEQDINRIKGYSERQNKGNANALYTSNGGQIDPGFLAAKMIKHAFRTYPKVRTGQFSELETEKIEPETQINYDLQNEAQQEQGNREEAFGADQEPVQEATVISEDNDDVF